MDQHTWDLVSPPPGSNIVGCQWVHKLKKHADGSVAHYKAQLVAKGFTQEAGIDYFETFSPVLKQPTIRVVLSMALHHGWHTIQLDVSNAFLHGQLDEVIFMQ